MGYQEHRSVDASLNHVQEQYNVMALVGNGFDVQVLNEYKQAPTTRYTDFYYYLKMKGIGPENLILGKMESLKLSGDDNWSDVERGISDLESEGTKPQFIQASLAEIQREFSEFLNRVVDSSLLSRLSDDSRRHQWSKSSLSNFLGDLAIFEDLKKITFGAKKGNYDLYNFYFVNFNYTSLLDNYLYLDSAQFSPRPYSSIGTNFEFDTNPIKLGPDTSWNFKSSSNLATQIVHPHGYQDIPRSLLFGTGFSGDPNHPQSQLAKPFWAQTGLKYEHLFGDTHLFVVFGCSLGETDYWWWNNIAQALKRDPERALMLYWWNRLDKPVDSEATVQDRFFRAAGVAEGDRHQLREQICVVSYNDDSERVWLATNRP